MFNDPMELTDSAPSMGLPLPLPQSPQFASALRAVGRRADMLYVREKGRTIGHALSISRQVPGIGWVRLTSQGPIWSASATSGEKRQAMELLRREGLWLINAAPGDMPLMSNAGYVQVMTPATIARLTLPDRGNWRDAAKTKWRNRLSGAIRKMESNGLRIECRPFDPASDGWFLDETEKLATARGFRDLPRGLLNAFAMINPAMAQVFLAHQGGRTVGGVLALRHGRCATYQSGWTTAEGRKTNANRILLARAADWLRDRGVERFDLGTIDTEGAPGLAMFKLGMGAQPVTLGGSWLARPRLIPQRALPRLT